MFCRKCGNQIPDDSSFCPYCGENVIKTENVYSMPVVKKVTFKEAIKDLFERIFVFEGRSTRSEFNYGYLFLMIISIVVSMITIYPTMLGAMKDITSMEEMEKILESITLSKDILSPFNLHNIGIAIITAVFLIAPVFRRLTDCNVSKKWAYVLAIIFAVSQVLCSSLLYCLLPTATYDAIYGILELLGLANSCIFICCVFVRSK